MGTRVRVRPVPWSSPDAYPSGGNPSLSHRWAKWHSRLMAPIESRTPDWRMGFGLQTARTGLRYRNPVIERTATSRVSKSFRGDLQLGKVAMPRGPRSEKRPADVIGAGRSAGVVGTARRKGGSGQSDGSAVGCGSDVRQGRTRSSRCAGQQEIKSYPEIDSRAGNRWHGRIVGPATVACRPSPRLCRELIGVD
jgi:hypothetical protein